MLLLAVSQIQMAQGVVAKVQSVEVTDRSLGPVDELIMGCGSVPVSISGIEIKLIQVRIEIQRIRERCAHRFDQAFVEFTDQSKSALALQRLKVVGPRWAMVDAVTVGLEIAPAGSHLLQDPVNPKMNPGGVGKLGAISEGVEGLNPTQGRHQEGVVNGTHREIEP